MASIVIFFSVVLDDCCSLLESCIQLKAELQTAMSQILYADAVDEWLAVSVDPVINKLARTVSVASQQIQLGARVKSTSVNVTMNPNATDSMQ